jgi:hypothetical protein
MNILFTNAVLWPLAALIAVPVLLHLFARARPPTFLYSSLQFLRRVIREQQRIKKPRDWLLLLLRTLFFAALIAAFLQPLWFGGRPSSAAAGRTVVLIVDATASMAAREGAQSRFAHACAESAEVLTGLTSRDRANVVWMRATPRAVFPQPGVNVGYLRNALREGRVTSEAADPAAALRLAADMLHDVAGRAEICIVSDFQRTTWRSLGVDVPANVTLTTIPVAEEVVPNLGIARIETRPARPLEGEEVQAFVEVRNFSPAPRQTVVHAEIGEVRSSQNIQVPAWGSASAVFAFRPPHSGQSVIAAHIAEDEFPDDNSAWRVVDVVPGLRAGLLAAASQGTATAWRRALRALPWVQLIELPATGWEAEAARCDALLLCGWDGSGAEAARAALSRGAPVLCYPARNAPAAALNDLTGAQLQGSLGWASPAKPLTLQLAAADDPAFAIFGGGDRGNPASGSFRGRLNVPALPGDWRTLLSYSDGTPALARFKPGGSLLLWNLELAPEVSSWASRMEFLPTFGELILSSRGGAAGPDSQPVATGHPLTLRPDRDLLPQSLRVEGPDARSFPVTRRDEEARPLYASVSAELPGLYLWKDGADIIGQTAVNFPSEESDLRTVATAEISRKGWAAVSGGRAARERREGVPIWPWFLGMALFCGAGEAVLAWLAVKK